MTTDWKRRSRSIRKERKNFKGRLRQENKHLCTNIAFVDDISRDEAKERILGYFEGHAETIYPSELSEWLCIDYELVWSILKELESEGKISSDN
jgi:hypothetical protein